MEPQEKSEIKGNKEGSEVQSKEMGEEPKKEVVNPITNPQTQAGSSGMESKEMGNAQVETQMQKSVDQGSKTSENQASLNTTESSFFDATIIPNPSDTYDENNSMYQSTYNTVDTSDHNHESIVENSFINEYVNDGENNDPDHHSEEAVESMDQEDQPYDEYDYNDYYYTQNDVYNLVYQLNEKSDETNKTMNRMEQNLFLCNESIENHYKQLYSMISDIQKHMNEPAHKEAEKDMNDSDMYYTICSPASSPSSPASPSNRTPKNILFDGIDTRRQSIEASIPDAKNYKELITKICDLKKETLFQILKDKERSLYVNYHLFKNKINQLAQRGGDVHTLQEKLNIWLKYQSTMINNEWRKNILDIYNDIYIYNQLSNDIEDETQFVQFIEELTIQNPFNKINEYSNNTFQQLFPFPYPSLDLLCSDSYHQNDSIISSIFPSNFLSFDLSQSDPNASNFFAPPLNQALNLFKTEQYKDCFVEPEEFNEPQKQRLESYLCSLLTPPEKQEEHKSMDIQSPAPSTPSVVIPKPSPLPSTPSVVIPKPSPGTSLFGNLITLAPSKFNDSVAESFHEQSTMDASMNILNQSNSFFDQSMMQETESILLDYDQSILNVLKQYITDDTLHTSYSLINGLFIREFESYCNILLSGTKTINIQTFPNGNDDFYKESENLLEKTIFREDKEIFRQLFLFFVNEYINMIQSKSKNPFFSSPSQDLTTNPDLPCYLILKYIKECTTQYSQLLIQYLQQEKPERTLAPFHLSYLTHVSLNAILQAVTQLNDRKKQIKLEFLNEIADDIFEELFDEEISPIRATLRF